MWVELSDGRVIGVPLAWFPRLLHATAADRKKARLSSRGLHWEALDEDVSVSGLLAGLGDHDEAAHGCCLMAERNLSGISRVSLECPIQWPVQRLWGISSGRFSYNKEVDDFDW